MTIIKRCNCKQAFQDRRYGKGLRAHNQMTKEQKWRCTGCGVERV